MRDGKLLRVGQPVFSAKDIASITADVAKILASGWLTTGRYAESFEKEFRSVVGTKHAISVSSGTAALHTILSAIGLAGKEIVVPADTFASSANAALYLGSKVRLADCDVDTFNVTAETLERSITPRTKAVMVTHVGGNPCEMREIESLCNERGLTLVEDAAHAIGSELRGRACGTFGVANAFSLYPTKVITSAEGGMITTDSDEIDSFARKFRNVGRKSLGRGPIDILGCNYRMSDVHAAIGLSQIGHLGEFLKTRRRLARVYDEQIEKLDWLVPQRIASHSKSSYYTYMVRLARGNRQKRDRTIKRLMERAIETTVMFNPIQLQPYSEGLVEASRNLKNSELVGATSIALPMHAGLGEEDVSHVVAALKDAR